MAIMIYLKLSLRNIKKLFKEYMLYFFTIIFCASIFFAFHNLDDMANFSNSLEYKDLCLYLAPVIQNVEIITNIVSLPIIFLVIYINNFIIRRRNRELATYVLMGMNKAYMGGMFFVENFVIGILSVLIGCLTGKILATLIKSYLVIINGYPLNIDYMSFLTWNKETIFNTVQFFMYIFMGIGIINTIKIIKTPILTLTKTDRINQYVYPYTFKKTILLAIFSSLFSVLFIASLNHALTSIGYVNSKWLIVSIIFLIMLNVLFIHLVKGILLILKKHIRKNTSLYTLCECSSQINTRTKVFGIISMVTCISILAISVCNILDYWGKANINAANIFDIQIENSLEKVKTNIALEEDITIIEEFISKDYTIDFGKGISLFVNEEKNENNPDFLIMKLSDFNSLRKVRGYDEVVLKHNEFIVYVSAFRSAEKEKEEIEKLESGLEIEDAILEYRGVEDEPLGNAILKRGKGCTIVVPDHYTEGLSLGKLAFVFDLKEDMTIEYNATLNRFVKEYFQKRYSQSSEVINCQTKVEMVATSKLGGLTVNLSSIYIGCFFAIICGTVLSIQQLVDYINGKRKLYNLFLLGLSKFEVYWLVFKQIFYYFSMPIIWGVFNFLIIIKVFSNCYEEIFKLILTNNQLLEYVYIYPIATFILFIIIYFCITSYLCLNGMKKELN